MSSSGDRLYALSAGTAEGDIVELEGRVSSGLGEGGDFTRMNWVLDQFISKLGLNPFPGTFNLTMDGVRWQSLLAQLKQSPGTEITPPQGFCRAKCFGLTIEQQIAGFWVLPEVADYPDDKLEIIAAVSVRQTLQLEDGDRIKIQLQTS